MLIARSLYALIRFLYAWSAALLIVGGLCLLVMLIHRKVYDHLLNDTQYQVSPGALVVVQKPDWVGEGIVRSIRTTFPYREPVSIFESGLTENIGQVYEGHPWVERVRFVRKQFPNRIQIAVDLRRPLAAIEYRGHYYLVDKQAVRLPGEYVKAPTLTFPVLPVIGVQEAPPREGMVWDAKDLRAGVAVAQALIDHGLPESAPVLAINVENTGGRIDARESEVVLWMADMVPVEWGRAPTGEVFGELPVARKLRNLHLILLACPDLKGVGRARIQYDSPTYEEVK